jgi:hypothetical protein
MMRISNRAGLIGIGFLVSIFTAIIVPCFDAHAADYPTVVVVTPADQEVRVPIDTTIVIQFDKEMDTDSVENSFEVFDQFENEIEGTFSWSTTVLTNDTVTFTPTQNLDYSLSYGIEIGGEDAINHYPLNGYWEDVESYFATVGAPGDDSAPEVITVLPYNGQIGGDTHFIAALFTKPLDPVTVTTLYVILSGPGISGYSVTFEYDPTPILMIEPDTPLAPNSDYTVTLTTGLTDTEGHALASQYEWGFNTGAADTTLPAVTQTIPANGAVDFAYWAWITIYFSESMDPDSITTSTVTVYDETALEYKDIHITKEDVDENGNRSGILLRPIFDDRIWTDGHTYTVEVSQTVTDLSGNPLGSNYDFTFTAVDIPSYAPVVRDDDCVGIRQHDGSTVLELQLDADGANGPDNLTVVATDVTQIGKNWTLTNDPGEGDFEYESAGDEGLNVGHHEVEFLVTDTINGRSTSLGWNFYIFNSAPSLTAPLDDARNVPTTPWLSWNTNGLVGDDMYGIMVFDGPDPDSAKVAWSTYFAADGNSSYSVKVPTCRALDPNTTYYWIVFAVDNHNWVQGHARSPFWSFTTGNDELAVDFGTNGLWHYDGSSWSNLAGWDPDGNMEAWTGGLAVDFGDSYGLWNYDGLSWTSLAGWDPRGMKVYGAGLAVDFDTYGLWYYNGSSWMNLASWDPEGMVTWGSNLAVDFGTYGLWNYNGSSWASLAGWNPSNIKAYGTGLALDFETYGLWYYNGTGWSSLANWNPEGMETWGSNLAVDFGTYGLWNYDGSSWTSLAGWDPDVIEAYSTGITVDFDTYGVWYYDGSSWTSFAGWNPEDMEAWANGLAVDFGASYGLWNYDGSSWTSLAGWDPEGMIDINLYLN